MNYFGNLDLTSEQLIKIESILSEKYIPKRVYDKITEDFEELNHKFIQSQNQLDQELKRSKDFEKLQKELEVLQSKFNQSEIDHENSLKRVKIDYAVLDRLKNEGARNVKVIQPLLNYDQLTLDEKDRLLGLEEQIKSLKSSEETSFLFHDSNCLRNEESESFFKNKQLNVSKKSTSINSNIDSLNSYARSLYSPHE